MQNITQISSLADKQLYDELVSLGYNIGPVTPTTRSLYEKKLLNHHKKAIIPGTANTSKSPARSSAAANTSRSAPKPTTRVDASRATSTDFVESKSQQTDAMKVSASTQARIPEPEITHRQARSQKYAQFIDDIEDEDTEYERRLYGISKNTKQAASKPTSSTSSSTQASFPLEFKLLDNPNVPKTQTYINVESIPSESNRSRDSPDFSYSSVRPGELESSPRGARVPPLRANPSPSRAPAQKHSFMNTSNFDKLNQNLANSHTTNYNEYSYIDYVSSNQPVNRKKNLLPLNPNALLKPSGSLYPDLSSYSQLEQHDSRLNAHYAKLYSAPMPPHVAAGVVPGEASKPAREFIKELVVRNWSYFGLLFVVFCVVYYLFVSSEHVNPIRL
jgi:hypothetical protein